MFPIEGEDKVQLVLPRRRQGHPRPDNCRGHSRTVSRADRDNLHLLMGWVGGESRSQPPRHVGHPHFTGEHCRDARGTRVVLGAGQDHLAGLVSTRRGDLTHDVERQLGQAYRVHPARGVESRLCGAGLRRGLGPGGQDPVVDQTVGDPLIEIRTQQQDDDEPEQHRRRDDP